MSFLLANLFWLNITSFSWLIMDDCYCLVITFLNVWFLIRYTYHSSQHHWIQYHVTSYPKCTLCRGTHLYRNLTTNCFWCKSRNHLCFDVTHLILNYINKTYLYEKWESITWRVNVVHVPSESSWHFVSSTVLHSGTSSATY